MAPKEENGLKPKMKVWITKYALTKGIFEMEVESQSEDGKGVYGKVWSDGYHGEGKEWHRTKESAIRRAEEMRQKKIARLKNQIEKLEQMKFG